MNKKTMFIGCLLATTAFTTAQAGPQDYFRGTYLSFGPTIHYTEYSDFKNITPEGSFIVPLLPVNDNKAKSFNLGADVAAGYDWYARFHLPVRTEVRFNFTGKTRYSPGVVFGNAPSPTVGMNTKVRSYGILFNALYDFNRDNMWIPYVGGGIGLAINKVSGTSTLSDGSLGTSVHGNRHEFAWDAMVGIDYKYSACTRLGIAYRFASLGEAEWSNIGGDSAIEARSVYDHSLLFNITLTAL